MPPTMKPANPSFHLAICGVNELHSAFLNPVTHMISIWDTTSREARETLDFAKICHPEMKILKLSFDDPMGDSGRGKLATAGDVRKALAFAESCGPGDHLLIHCRAGIARSRPTISMPCRVTVSTSSAFLSAGGISRTRKASGSGTTRATLIFPDSTGSSPRPPGAGCMSFLTSTAGRGNTGRFHG